MRRYLRKFSLFFSLGKERAIAFTSMEGTEYFCDVVLTLKGDLTTGE